MVGEAKWQVDNDSYCYTECLGGERRERGIWFSLWVLGFDVLFLIFVFISLQLYGFGSVIKSLCILNVKWENYSINLLGCWGN